MNREQKAAVVDEIADQITAAEAVFAVDYRGINVTQIADVRAKLRESDTKLRVVKNSLSERAADKAGAEALKPLLIGPTALALVGGDVAVAARALSDVQRALRGPLEFKGGVLNGVALSAEDVRSIARLPARDVLHAQLVGTIAAPLTGLARTLNALISGLAIQLQALADQGLVGAGAAAAPEEPESEAAVESEPEPSAESEAGAEGESEPSVEGESEAGAEGESEPSVEGESEAGAEGESETAATATEPEAPSSTQANDETEQPESDASSDDGPSEE
jgi:large subunit ribosomal protein L10